MAEYGFKDRMQMSEGVAESSDVSLILLGNVPGAAEVLRAVEIDDRSGVDWWVKTHARYYSVDAKVRSVDFKQQIGCDDLALETWSVIEAEKVGWTRDETKQCDYILFLWSDTHRWCLMPFMMLCKVFQDRWESWREKYKVDRQTTKHNGSMWHSECVFVPRRLVWREIYQKFNSQLET